jgi:hypothetical protein
LPSWPTERRGLRVKLEEMGREIRGRDRVEGEPVAGGLSTGGLERDFRWTRAQTRRAQTRAEDLWRQWTRMIPAVSVAVSGDPVTRGLWRRTRRRNPIPGEGPTIPEIRFSVDPWANPVNPVAVSGRSDGWGRNSGGLAHWINDPETGDRSWKIEADPASLWPVYATQPNPEDPGRVKPRFAQWCSPTVSQ